MISLEEFRNLSNKEKWIWVFDVLGNHISRIRRVEKLTWAILGIAGTVLVKALFF